MKIILSFYVLFILFIIIYMLKIWDVRNAYGKHILKLRNRKEFLIFFIVGLVFWICLLVLNIRNYMIHDSHRDLSQILLSVMWILICFVHISRTFKYSEVRENGIYLEQGFYSWSKIHSFEWISSDTIKFKAQRFTLRNFEEKMEVHYEDNVKVDEILRKYIEPCSPPLT